MKKKDVRDIVGEYNPGEDLSGKFYDASYPRGLTKLKKGEITKPETEVYPAFFDIYSEKTEYYIDKLKEYAEERKYKVEKGLSVQLDETVQFSNFVENILYRMYDDFNDSIVSEDSLIALKLKEIIREKYDEYPNMSNSQYVKSRLKLIRKILSSYTQLRIFVINYLCLKEDYNPRIREVMNRIDTYKHENMTPSTKDLKKNEEYRQLVLTDFIKM